MTNVVQFPASRRTLSPSSISQSDRDYINARIERKLAERTASAPAAPIGEASIVQFPSPCAVASVAVAERDICDNEWHRAFGRALREVRIKAGVSIEDAAAVAERTVETWCNYEKTGRGRMTYPLYRLAMHYGIRLEDIFKAAEAACGRSQD